MLSERQQRCLEGMGIAVWRKRNSSSGGGAEISPAPALLSDDEAAALGRFIDPRPATTDDPAATASAPQSPAAAPQPPATENKGDASLFPARPSPTVDIDLEKREASPLLLDSWDAIDDAIHGCQACELAQNCTQKVPGVGSRGADLLIVGEGPGHDEDIQGEPFVGRSGQLLDRMLAAIGIKREQVFITNIVKCRPPNNRDPKPEEAQHCRAYLEAQIEQLSPKVILSVGRVSAHNLLGSSEPVGKLIKRMHRLPGTDIPVKVTYHPAYLLRNPSAKAIAWQDMKQLYQLLQ